MAMPTTQTDDDPGNPVAGHAIASDPTDTVFKSRGPLGSRDLA